MPTHALSLGTHFEVATRRVTRAIIEYGSVPSGGG